MGRVKEIEDKAKAPKLDTGATKRFMRRALWQNAHKEAAENSKTGFNRLIYFILLFTCIDYSLVWPIPVLGKDVRA